MTPIRLALTIEPPDGGDRRDHAVHVDELVIGRSPSAGLVLTDPGVSRQQARIVRNDSAWWIEALAAQNPTFLNDRRVSQPVRLAQGDVLKMGGTAIRVVGLVQEVPPAPVVPPAAVDGQAARLGILNDVHRALAAAISLPQLLDLILERCFGVLLPEEGVILLKDPEGTLRVAASRRQPDATADVFVSRRIVEEVVGKGKPALILDAAMDERLTGSESLVNAGIRSVVAAPLVDADGSMGLITLSSRMGVRRFSDQDLDLLCSLASAAALRVRNVALAEEAAARRVLERELAIAHDIQMSMLPRRMPDRAEVALAASLKPARSVGGDLYDFCLDADRLWFIVADVAGKGVGAALYMAVVKALFRASAHSGAAVVDVASRMNSELARDNETMLFVTAMIGTVTLPSGDVHVVDAGHNPAAVVDRHGRVKSPDVPKGVALGVVDGFLYEEGCFTLAPADTLVLYTDGATEARSQTGAVFGADQLMATIAPAAGYGPAPLVAAIASAVERFSAGAPPEDDITLLAIEYLGRRGAD